MATKNFKIKGKDSVNDLAKKKGVSSTLRYAYFGGTLIAMISIFGFFGLDYEKKHPIVCESSGIVKEILSIEQHFAQIKLADDRILNHNITRHSSSRGGTSTYYFAKIKPGDEICLNYIRKSIKN